MAWKESETSVVFTTFMAQDLRERKLSSLAPVGKYYESTLSPSLGHCKESHGYSDWPARAR